MRLKDQVANLVRDNDWEGLLRLSVSLAQRGDPAGSAVVDYAVHHLDLSFPDYMKWKKTEAPKDVVNALHRTAVSLGDSDLPKPQGPPKSDWDRLCLDGMLISMVWRGQNIMDKQSWLDQGFVLNFFRSPDEYEAVCGPLADLIQRANDI